MEKQKPSKVSFVRDIKPLFRAVDISHMKSYAVKLDDFSYMSNPEHANAVLRTLSPHGDKSPSMPPGGPFWTHEQLALFAKWQTDGYQP